MSKSKHNKYNDRYADRDYVDGYGVDNRTERKNKREERRYQRALRTKDVSNLSQYDEDYNGAFYDREYQ